MPIAVLEGAVRGDCDDVDKHSMLQLTPYRDENIRVQTSMSYLNIPYKLTQNNFFFRWNVVVELEQLQRTIRFINQSK